MLHHPPTSRNPSLPVGAQDEFVCWTRMQAEAGQALAAIIGRKERERQAGNGHFCWGVGNAPALMSNALARLNHHVPVVFSIMKSKPKPSDMAPEKTLIWRRFIDATGIERELPPNAVVTSRGGANGVVKKRHFALMCFSDLPLRLECGKVFDPSAYRNAGGTGAAVGASQVTALLRRVSRPANTADYEVNLTAELADSYWVRLTDPLELTRKKIETLEAGAGVGVENWLRLVADLREGPAVVHAIEPRQTFI